MMPEWTYPLTYPVRWLHCVYRNLVWRFHPRRVRRADGQMIKVMPSTRTSRAWARKQLARWVSSPAPKLTDQEKT